MLLRFRATNHKSLRDTTELVLTKSGFDAVRPRDGDWGAVTNQVVGLFGANASGKSTVLDAMSFAAFAVRTSSSWSDREEIPHKPFLLDGESSAQSSAYEFDFTVHGVRHVYGFELTARGIASEWLSNFPKGRRRLLFERSGPEPSDISFSRNLKGENVRTARLLGGKNLFLSVAAMANHPDLKRIHHQLSGHMVYADFSEGNQTRRMEAVKRWLEEERYVRQAHSLLRFADLGITRVSLEENELTPGLRLVVKRTLSALHEARGEELDEPTFTEFMEGQKKAIAFWHEAGGGAAPRKLDLVDESSGTVAWLALALPALREIQYGGTLLVDELDASLHPHLASALISFFKSPEINPRGAQLVFTSHDTSLMGHLSGESLGADEVWFAEKGGNGVTDLYPLTDFPVKKDQNIERRYLGGRYGAVPSLAWEELRSTLVEITS
ncbi:AAA family ATPase [Streptomyces sp. SPB074]|uniref:AAA family ATPase n=1 Tax=Streptomyces sp. (strain SPB074) TaxID=465543 RepID=UPI00017F20B5|nr:ATP-binding protein [Streptomyces sp. SPB074]EDY44885.1 abortive infection protein [Streptomyces sp. SPB074]